MGFCTGFPRIRNPLCYPVLARELNEFSASEKHQLKCFGKLLFVILQGLLEWYHLLFYTGCSPVALVTTFLDTQGSCDFALDFMTTDGFHTGKCSFFFLLRSLSKILNIMYFLIYI